MKVFLIIHSDSHTNYFKLNNYCDNLTFIFKTTSDLDASFDFYDFMLIEQSVIEFDADLYHLQEITPLNKVFLILPELKADLVHYYLSLGIKDVFVQPVNLFELSNKLKNAALPKKSSLLSNFKSGMSLKQMLILDILETHGPLGVTRDQIMQEIWDNEVVEPKNVDYHIHHLRKILRKQGKEIRFANKRWFLVE